MRSILFTLVFCMACATTGGPRPINIAGVRNEIQGTIRSTTNDRQIHSMGRVREDRAVVYTTNKQTGARQEETWVKDGPSWKLENAQALSAAPATDAN